ncbi:uncharacterized protein [Antedon mediterranea]|uniref:uncharacterized protein n=1 Tax=Antedon mediterranea TaxID=105859 RepID=UPI003AF94D32
MYRTIILEVFLFVLTWSSNAYILENPQSTTRLQGEPVVLKCRVNNTANCNIYWYRVDKHEYVSEGINIFTDLGKDAERYSVTGNASQGEYNLNIQKLRVDDDGQYNCVCYSLVTLETIYSDIAQLTILSPPDANQPTCLTRPPETEIIIGHNVTFICESFGGKPPAKLEWNLGNVTLPGSYEVGFFPRNTYTRKITADDKGAVFICNATSRAIRKITACKIGPIRIQQHAQIRITPSVAYTLEGKSISFTCSHQTENPSVYKSDFFWSINGKKILHDSKEIKFSIDHKTMHIVSAKKTLDKATVRCELKSTYQTLAFAEAKIVVRTIKIPRPLLVIQTQSTTEMPTKSAGNSFLSLDPNEKRGFIFVLLLNSGGIGFLALLIITLFCTPKLIRKCRSNQKRSIRSISGSSRSSSSGYREVNYSHRNQQVGIVNNDEIAHLYAATDDMENAGNRNSIVHSTGQSPGNATLHIVLHSANEEKKSTISVLQDKKEQDESFYMIPKDPPVPKYPGRPELPPAPKYPAPDIPAPKYPERSDYQSPKYRERSDYPAPKYPERSDYLAPKYPETSDHPAPKYPERSDYPAPKYPGRSNSSASGKNPFLSRDQSFENSAYNKVLRDSKSKPARRHSTGEKLKKPKQYANVDYDDEDDPFLISY